MKSQPQSALMLLQMFTTGSKNEKEKALSVLARLRGVSRSLIAAFTKINPGRQSRYWSIFSKSGTAQLFVQRRAGPPKSDDTKIASTVFSLLHSPPIEHGFNRTSWRLADIRTCMLRNGRRVSVTRISRIIRTAGFRWRKAKIVLTSNDPEYREKLKHLKRILSNLGENDRFFSIDEFGPFSLKMKGGKRLVAPGEAHSVPQFQKSKGCLIITAALELSHNQVTHFYSKKKNTLEMVKLLEVLVKKYGNCKKLYFSWDAASWHASKLLFETVEYHNALAAADGSKLPLIELVPLPASAQFLNVIESVFSGMAKAIIHNSDYQSEGEAKAAIDRYFQERNEYFTKNPKRAGNKIWGQERVPPAFAEDQNCKDPIW